MRQFIPWYLKIGAKIALSRIPVSYRFWSNIGLFKHGKMTDPDYAIKIFFLHFDQVFGKRPPDNSVFLEMGPGDSIASAVCAASVETKKIYLVDVGHFATHDMNFYCRLSGILQERGGTPLDISEDIGFDNLLDACSAKYLTDGLFSLHHIRDNSVDYAWSHSMMEHVRKHDFCDTVKEHYRIMKPGGVVSHNIDLQDHLGGNLNNLRFSEKVWESNFMVESGFYTNRLRASEIIRTFQKAGFTIENEQRGQWSKIPTPRTKMAMPFNHASDKDLLTRTLSLHLRKPIEEA